MPLIPVLEQKTIHDLLLVLDLAGTFVFAISGAMLGVRRSLDIFGILVLSFAASSAGGITRDLLIGAVPPAAISDWRYLAVALAAGLLAFFSYSLIARVRTAILIFDAAGLALFAVAGTQKALAYGLNPLMAALLGMLTGIGGGIVRDLLVARTPAVLRSDLYALAALAGAVLVVVGHGLNWPIVPTAIAGAGVCFGLRLMAIRYGWNLPVARPIESGDEGTIVNGDRGTCAEDCLPSRDSECRYLSPARGARGAGPRLSTGTGLVWQRGTVHDIRRRTSSQSMLDGSPNPRP